MPDDRLIHKRACHSEKVASLTDFEYRVWTTYILNADDYGVMRFSAAALRSGSDALERKSIRVLEQAWEQLAYVGLIRTFEHQGRRYAYQHDWQDWQHVRYPRHTVNPLPPSPLITSCSEAQQKLFAMVRGNTPVVAPKDYGNIAEGSPSPADAGGPEVANGNGKRLTANGQRQDDGFEEFWRCYPKRKAKDAALRAWRKLRPDQDLQATICAAVEAQTHSSEWLKDGGQFIPYPATWLNRGQWTDQPVEIPHVSAKHAKSLEAIYGDD